MNEIIPEDNADQSNAFKMAKECISEAGIKKGIFLDLGCGNGNAVDYVRAHFKEMHYIGIDIEGTLEVSSRKRNDAKYLTYDGINLPFEDESISVIFSRQVFEHVRYPRRLLAEIYRVLKKGGCFVGSVSQLEPYHSYSIFNYTYYGFCVILKEHNLHVKKLRPGIDSISLINRNFSRTVLKRKTNLEDCFFGIDSPLNYSIDKYMKSKGISIKEINIAKLQVCGHLCFFAVKDY